MTLKQGMIYAALIAFSLLIGGFITQRYYKPAIISLQKEIDTDRKLSKDREEFYIKRIDSLTAETVVLEKRKSDLSKKLPKNRQDIDTNLYVKIRNVSDSDTLLFELRKIYN